MEALRDSGMLRSTKGCFGILVELNGKTLDPEVFEKTRLKSGDVLFAKALPKGIEAILLSIAVALSNIGGALAGSVGLGSVAAGIGGAAAGAAGLGVVGTAIVGGIVGGLAGIALFAGASFLLSLAVKALIGSPSSPDSGGVATGSPRARGIGNKLFPDNPIPIPLGMNVRVTPPMIAMPFQPGFSGGDFQDPSLRVLIGTAGDYTPTAVKIGDTDATIPEVRAEWDTFVNAKTVNFPTVLRKNPGILLRDEYGGSPWEIVSTDDEVDELSMTWQMASGLNRTDEAGEQEVWQVVHETQYRAVGSGTWLGFYSRDAAGNSGSYRVPFVRSFKRNNTRIVLSGRTTEAFYWFQRRKVIRDQYEIRFRLQNEPLVLEGKKANKKKNILIAHWPRDRGVGGTGNTDTVALATDPQLTQLLGFRNEPAVENCPTGLSGLDLTLLANTAKSDDSSRISYLASPAVPELSGGNRTAAVETANPIAHVLNLLTNTELVADTAIENAQIDWDSWQAAFDYCNETVPPIGGGAPEARHEIYGVLDRGGVDRMSTAQEILSSFRMRLAPYLGKYHVIIDRERTAPVFLYTEAHILEMESERTWQVHPDVFRTEFWNQDEEGEKDELRSYFSVPAVAGKIEHGGFAQKTASLGDPTPVATTITRSADYAHITLTGAETWAGFPEEGWISIAYAALYANEELFAIDNVSGDLKTLTVIDKDPGILTAGSPTGQFWTTKADRVEKLSLPYTGRASEVWRESQYRHRQALRPEVYRILVGIAGLAVSRGDMAEFQGSITAFGLGEGLVIGIAGTIGAVTAIQFDNVFDIAGVTNPSVRIRTWNGTAPVLTRIDVDPTETANARAGGDDRWVGFASPENLSTLGLKIGDGNGSAAAFGERDFETRELVVQEIFPGDEGTFTLHCIDHAPEIFTVHDDRPVPRYTSGVIDRLAGGARPAWPSFMLTDAAVSSGMRQIDVATFGNAKYYDRPGGETWSYLTRGFTVDHKITAEGFTTDPDNNVTRFVQDASPTAARLSITNAAGGVETGDGDERILGVIGSIADTVDIDHYSTGFAQITVDPQGGGVVHLDDTDTTGAFASFRGAGFVRLTGSSDSVNDGWWEIQSKTDANQLVLQNATTMVAATGTGSERAEQSQVFRAGGGFFTDGIAVNHRLRLDGFAATFPDMGFTVRKTLDTALALDDPFGRLVTEAGTGDETVTVVKASLSYEIESDSRGELRMWVIVPLRAGTKTLVTNEEIEVRFRLRDPLSGVLTTGWTTSVTVPSSATSARVGPVPVLSDFDVAARAISRDGIGSLYNALTGNGAMDRPVAPAEIQIHSDSVRTAEGSQFSLRVEWSAPSENEATAFNYLLRWRRQGADAWASMMIYDKREAVIIGAQIGTYTLELYTLGDNGRPSEPTYGLFDFEPDRDFEDVSVFNLRLVNHA